MDIKPIKSENDYQEALKRLDEIFDAKIAEIVLMTSWFPSKAEGGRFLVIYSVFYIC